MPATVLGDIIERPSNNKIGDKDVNRTSKFASDVPTGFPKAVHRSQSAFARARAAKAESLTRSNVVPSVSSSSSHGLPSLSQSASLSSSNSLPPSSLSLQGATNISAGRSDDDTQWRKQMEQENNLRVAEMSDAQREEERNDIISQLGPGILDLVARLKDKDSNDTDAQRDHTQKGEISHSGPTGSILVGHTRSDSSDVSSRPGTAGSIPGGLGTPKSKRKLRFSEGPDQVFVYESQPPSPRRVIALLPPPDTTSSGNASDANTTTEPPPIPLTYKSRANKATKEDQKSGQEIGEQTKPMDKDLNAEHTPEAIRERYFPNEPPPSENPNLAWLLPSNGTSGVSSQPPQSGSSSSSSHLIRYDLKGRVIPQGLTETLPTYLGLHHHGESPDQAGYTLDELLLLSRSTLPAQRAVMLHVISHLIHRLLDESGAKDEKEDPDDIAQKSIIVAIEAFGERSSTAVRLAGLDVLRQVFNSNHPPQSRFYSLKIITDPNQFETLPISFLLSGTLFNVTRTALSAPSITHIIEVMHGLVVLSPKLAEEIVGMQDLLNGTISSISQLENEDPSGPSLALLLLLQQIAMTSRSCARALIPDVADAFLKNFVLLPSLQDHNQPDRSPSQSLARFKVIVAILDFYIILARYGLYSSIAMSSQGIFRNLENLVLEQLPFDSEEHLDLVSAWLRVYEAWIACATDPHQTTPEHDIIWSQIVAMDWPSRFLALQTRFNGAGMVHAPTWSMLWRVWSMWFNGCRINEPDGGKAYQTRWAEVSTVGWSERGAEILVFNRAIDVLTERDGSLAQRQQAASAVHAAIRLYLAFAPDGASNASALWSTISVLPLETVINIVERVLSDSRWTQSTQAEKQETVREWTNLLCISLRLLRLHQQEDTSPAKSGLTHVLQLHHRVLDILQPGDEMLAAELISFILDTTLVQSDSRFTPEAGDIWSTAGGPSKILLPLYQYSLWPRDDLFIAPYIPYPAALKMTTTILPPKDGSIARTPSGGIVGIELPQRRSLPGNWLVAPLDILLRSGSTHTRLFRTLPSTWNASETDVVRSLLLFILQSGGTLSPSQIIFTCMKVFMLEHDQSTEGSDEVYSNPNVVRLMNTLLHPLQFSSRLSSSPQGPEPSAPTVMPNNHDNIPLEEVATSYLGNDQPFYQFYSDFLGLYDSASFGNPLFGALLLPPTSQMYAKDYRRLLWGDYGHSLRSIQPQVEDLLYDGMAYTKLGTLGGPGECGWLLGWLWPIEGRQDGEMLGNYLKVLLKHHLSGFPRFLAIHQVAFCLWPDLRQIRKVQDKVPFLDTTIIGGNQSDIREEERQETLNRELKEEKIAANLLKTLMAGGDEDLRQDILHYRQFPADGDKTSICIPPQCYLESQDSVINSRVEWAASICGDNVRMLFPPLSSS